MRPTLRMANAVLLAGGLVSTMAVAGCYHRHYDHDRDGAAVMVWSNNEEPQYEQWEHETHRDHKDWNQRNNDEQHQYWQWRQQHSQ